VAKRQAEFLGHPVGLYVLFFTEMWERFSYYGMRALLVLYMVNYFKWTQENASSIYKWYTSLVYLTPLAGGYLADRYLGNKRAIIIGAALMAIGHFLMAFEAHTIFYGALVFLILGNGFFKPNMSTQVGRLYPANDPRRDSAYTIFYMGINLGAFASPIVCGALRQHTRWGFHAGFTAAGIGMVLGLVIYLLFIKWVEELPEEATYQGGEDEEVKDEALKRAGVEEKPETHYMTEAEAAAAPSVTPLLARIAPAGLLVLAGASVVAAVALWLLIPKIVPLDTAVALALGGGFACTMGAWITKQLDMAVRDRVLAIFIVAVFVVFFWAAFEQAGNAMNLFAEKTTDRYLTEDAPPPSIYPDVAIDEDGEGADATSLAGTIVAGFNPLSGNWFSSGRPFVVIVFAVILFWLWRFFPRPGSDLHTKGKVWISLALAALGFFPLMVWLPTATAIHDFFNPLAAEPFQSINALAIFLLAPLFAWMWIYLPKHGINLSIPAKVTIGVAMQAVAFLLMYASITYENGPSNAQLAALPDGVTTQDNGRVVLRDAPDLADAEAFEKFTTNLDDVTSSKLSVVHGSRLYYDGSDDELKMTGVLADVDRDRILRATVGKEYLLKIKKLAEKSQAAAAEEFEVSVTLDPPPPGFDIRYAGLKPSEVSFDTTENKLVAKTELADKDYKGLLVCGSDPEFREAMNHLYVNSAQYKVSPMWLFWFYILCTIGELCLSPVGLSMVSKLAPAKFATMLMGMWLLTNFFGNFFAGFAGEQYGKMHPADYFMLIAIVSGGRLNQGSGILIVILVAVVVAYIFLRFCLVFAIVVGGASLICLLTVKKTKAMMHGVN